MLTLSTVEDLALKIQEIKQQDPSTPVMVLSDKGVPCNFSVGLGYYVLNSEGKPRLVCKSSYDRVKQATAYYERISAKDEWDSFGPMEKAYYEDNFSVFDKFIQDSLASFKAELFALEHAAPCFTVQMIDTSAD